MYIGPTTEEAPTAIPPRKRNNTNTIHAEVMAQPIAESKYKIAMPSKTAFRPLACVKLPTMSDPKTVPIRLEATVNPSQKEFKAQKDCIVPSAPEITAVSKPNKKPPKAAISAIRVA